MLEPRDGSGLIANRFQPIRALRPNVVHARDGRRHVAIELVPARDHDLAEMRRTIAIANAIDHPNLCRPREVIEHADQLVIVTELVEGISIADRLVIGPYDPLQVGALMVELLSVLSRLHAEKLAHGGVSPSTVMIDAAGLLRLIDIGVVRGPHRPTARLDIEGVGALAKAMLAGYLGSVPGPLLAWIARCSDQVRPFADAAAAAAGLIASEWTAPETRRTAAGLKKISIPPRNESSVAIKIPTLDEPARPLEVVPTDVELRRGRTPSAMVKTAEALALAETLAKPTVETSAQPVATEPTAPDEIEPALAPDVAPAGAPDVAIVAKAKLLARAPVAVVAPRPSRFPWLAGALAAAVVATFVFVWWVGQPGPELPPPAPSVVWESQPIEMPRVPNALRPLPPLPTGAVLPTDVVAPPAAPAKPDDTLAVVFSAESAWIETAGVYVLQEAYRQLLKHPTARVEVTGYSSNDGKPDRNEQLAIGRAIAVKRSLVDRGVDPARISTVAKANLVDDPVRSRRAEIKIVP